MGAVPWGPCRTPVGVRQGQATLVILVLEHASGWEEPVVAPT
jgi:hypothetical protein